MTALTTATWPFLSRFDGVNTITSCSAGVVTRAYRLRARSHQYLASPKIASPVSARAYSTQNSFLSGISTDGWGSCETTVVGSEGVAKSLNLMVAKMLPGALTVTGSSAVGAGISSTGAG